MNIAILVSMDDGDFHDDVPNTLRQTQANTISRAAFAEILDDFIDESWGTTGQAQFQKCLRDMPCNLQISKAEFPLTVPLSV